MQFDSSKSGIYYQLQNGDTFVINSSGRFASAGIVTSGIVIVQLTGYYSVSGSGAKMYQTSAGEYIDLADGWTEYATGTLPYYSVTQAQRLVNKIIANNKHILQNNILCARFSKHLTKEERDKLYFLQARLQTRNAAVEKDGICTNVQTDYPAGYAELENYLTLFMESGGEAVGLAPIVYVVVAAVVVAGMGTAAYFAYKNFAAESEQDVKYSDALTKTLTSKLTAEEYQQLLDETKGIVTKARIKASLSGATGLIKYAAIGVGVFAAVRFIQKQIAQ